jgi:hypothetical protein
MGDVETSFVYRCAELMDLERCDVRRLVAKGVTGLRVRKLRRLEKMYTIVPPYPRVMRSKTYRAYLKPRIIPNAIYNVIFV